MIYEYKCKDCELVFEEMRPMADRREPIDCPACSGEGEYKISTPSFKTSGGGHGQGWDGKGQIK